VALGISNVESEVLAYVEAGIAGYVPRDGSLEDLAAVVDSVARDESVVTPRVAASLMRRVKALASDRAPSARNATLTAREGEIAYLIEQGKSNKEIAVLLNIEVATVKNHVHNILEKLHINRRGQVSGNLHRQDRWRRPGRGWLASREA
jgi:DNA-binding NarL/FixJ family response regulator